MPGLAPGVWHVRGRVNDLVPLADLPDEHWLHSNLSGLYRAPWMPQATVVISAVFARNMYRYREPRTFRSVFLDVGHVVATVEAVSRALGVRSHAHHAMNDGEVERLLGLSSLREGVVAGVALGRADS